MANGYIIIKHQVFREISDDEVLEFLPNEDGVPRYKIFDIRKEIINMEAIHILNNQEYRIYQKNVFENEIRPYLADHPEYKVLYFGTATIPLALHLGYCFGAWRDVDVYLLSRERNKWELETDTGSTIEFDTNYVKEEFAGPIDVIFKVEATYLMQNDDLKQAVDIPHKIMELKLKSIGKDVFVNQEQMKQFAYQFSLGIDAVANYLPNTDRIHLFPTVPVGIAFLMGAKINPLVTKPIVTYQFNTNSVPKYEQILILQENTDIEVNIEAADSKKIADIKNELKEQLENKIGPLVKQKQEDKKRYNDPQISWIKAVLPPENDYSEIECRYWKGIPGITETILDSSKLTVAVDKAGDGFYISENNEWQINDRFIFNIQNRLKENGAVLRALRLFVFHESIHIFQKLTNYTAQNVGRFPRVLEEADYIADVWAMIHEFYYSKTYNSSETINVKEFFMSMIDIALNTMLAFDDLDSNSEEMQMRRVNRYLIWYWNYLQIEDRSCDSLSDIINILANKPIIEIRGLDIRAQSQRTIFKLTNYAVADLELAYIDPTGRILRASNAGGLNIDEIVKGFKERNGQRILRQLKSWYHQIRT